MLDIEVRISIRQSNSSMRDQLTDIVEHQEFETPSPEALRSLIDSARRRAEKAVAESSPE